MENKCLEDAKADLDRAEEVLFRSIQYTQQVKAAMQRATEKWMEAQKDEGEARSACSKARKTFMAALYVNDPKKFKANCSEPL